MNPTVSIFVAATPLLASSGAEAARGTAGGSTNLMLPPTPPASTAQLPTLSAACSPTRGWGPCQALQDLPLTIPSERCHRSIIRALPLHPRLERRLPV
jgi:hypothetical protein